MMKFYYLGEKSFETDFNCSVFSSTLAAICAVADCVMISNLSYNENETIDSSGKF